MLSGVPERIWTSDPTLRSRHGALATRTICSEIMLFCVIICHFYNCNCSPMWWHVRWYTRYSVSKLLAGLWKTDVWLVFRFVFAGTAIWFGYLHHTITFVTSLPSELFLKTESYRILFCLFLLCAYYSAWYTCRNHPAGKSWVTTLPGLITESAPMVSPAYIVAFAPIKFFLQWWSVLRSQFHDCAAPG